jgi:hypothetical protein
LIATWLKGEPCRLIKGITKLKIERWIVAFGAAKGPIAPRVVALKLCL